MPSEVNLDDLARKAAEEIGNDARLTAGYMADAAASIIACHFRPLAEQRDEACVLLMAMKGADGVPPFLTSKVVGLVAELCGRPTDAASLLKRFGKNYSAHVAEALRIAAGEELDHA